MQLFLAAIVAALVLGACGSSGGGAGGAGSGDGDSPTTTAVSPAHVGVNEQTGGPGGTDASGGTDGTGGGPILTDAQREAALCERSGKVGADDENNSSGSGDAKNFAAVAQGLGDAIDEKCADRAEP